MIPPIRRTLAPCALVLLGACDPVFYMNVRQPLSPVPAPDCLERALAASPRVRELEPRADRREPGFYVTLRDTMVSMRPWMGHVTRRPAADSMGEVVTMTYAWMGYDSPTPRQRTKMRAVAEAVLADVRAARAPASPPATECEVTGALLPPRACGSTA